MFNHTATRPGAPPTLLWLIAATCALGGVMGCVVSDDDERPSNLPIGAWTLTWEETFDGAAGEAPDPARWTYDIGTGVDGWGNNQLEYNTDRPENVALDGQGNLVITARREDFQGSEYTSARMLTRDLFTQAYGRFEARIKLPVGRGIWPAFWMLGDDIDEVSWPRCGEIDIMEYRGQEPWAVTGSLHGPGYSGGSPITSRFTMEDRGSFADDFHVFAVEWHPSRIAWLVDGEVYHVATPAQAPSGQWVFDHPFFLLLNVAVGGNYVGSPDDTTPFPQQMLVDYVRVYTYELLE